MSRRERTSNGNVAIKEEEEERRKEGGPQKCFRLFSLSFSQTHHRHRHSFPHFSAPFLSLSLFFQVIISPCAVIMARGMGYSISEVSVAVLILFICERKGGCERGLEIKCVAVC